MIFRMLMNCQFVLSLFSLELSDLPPGLVPIVAGQPRAMSLIAQKSRKSNSVRIINIARRTKRLASEGGLPLSKRRNLRRVFLRNGTGEVPYTGHQSHAFWSLFRKGSPCATPLNAPFNETTEHGCIPQNERTAQIIGIALERRPGPPFQSGVAGGNEEKVALDVPKEIGNHLSWA